MAAFGYSTPDPMEPEECVQCPYDKNHHILHSRFPYHLVKCREKNPQIAKNFSTCFYNARHVMPKKELQRHLQTCEDKVVLELPLGNGNILPGNNLPQHLPQSSPNQENFLQRYSPRENWDDDCGGAVFMLRSFGSQKPCDPSDMQDSCNPSVSTQYTGTRMNPGPGNGNAPTQYTGTRMNPGPGNGNAPTQYTGTRMNPGPGNGNAPTQYTGTRMNPGPGNGNAPTQYTGMRMNPGPGNGNAPTQYTGMRMNPGPGNGNAPTQYTGTRMNPGPGNGNAPTQYTGTRMNPGPGNGNAPTQYTGMRMNPGPGNGNAPTQYTGMRMNPGPGNGNAPTQYTGTRMNQGTRMNPGPGNSNTNQGMLNPGVANRNLNYDGGNTANQWETVSKRKPRRNHNSGNGQPNQTGR